MIQLSVIVAVYNRSDELTELLQSFSNQTDKDFEVIIADDGSQENLKKVVEKFSSLNPKYYYKTNSGPGLTRNFGSEKAEGNYFLFIDSDCIAPENYIENIKKELTTNYVDAFGGSDRAHESFNAMQKAISYAMTSVFTTGGIRGKAKSVTKFQPRSFNMGISKEAFRAVVGFSEMRIGEDPDLSLSLWEKGYTTRFLTSVKVFHKRRSTLKSFAKQVYQFGIARPILDQRHPKYRKWIFWFPSIFLFGLVSSLLLFIIQIDSILLPIAQFFDIDFILNEKVLIINIYQNILQIPLLCYTFYFTIIFLHSLLQHKNIKVALLSIVTSVVQLCNYGYGFLKSFIKINVLKKSPKEAFPTHFY